MKEKGKAVLDKWKTPKELLLVGVGIEGLTIQLSSKPIKRGE